MLSLYILLGAISLFNSCALIAMSYFMYKSTFEIAAFKKSNYPWEVSTVLRQEENAVENESEQTDGQSFGTIPTDDETLTSLRNQL